MHDSHYVGDDGVLGIGEEALQLTIGGTGRRLFTAPLPTFGIPLPDRRREPVMLAGAAMAAYGLWFVAAGGFAPDGHLPWVTALIFAIGAVLVALRPRQVSQRSVDPALRPDEPCTSR